MAHDKNLTDPNASGLQSACPSSHTTEVSYKQRKKFRRENGAESAAKTQHWLNLTLPSASSLASEDHFGSR
jgi:hypothetical protein